MGLHRLSLPNGEHGVICYYYDFSNLREVEAGMRDAHTRSR